METIEIDFDEEKGELHMQNNPIAALTRGQLAWLQRECEKILGPAAAQIMYNSARVYSQEANSNIKSDIIKLLGQSSKEKVAKKMVERLGRWGYGKAELIKLDGETPYGKIKLENSANAIGYEEAQRPVCNFIRGIFAGGGTVLLDQEMHCIENKCKAMGHEHCEFEIITLEEEQKRRIDD